MTHKSLTCKSTKGPLASWQRLLPFCALLLICLLGCPAKNAEQDIPGSPTAAQQLEVVETKIRFRDVAAECGVNFTAHNGRDQGHYSILESLGSGIALLDFDVDQRLDVLAAGGGTFDETPSPIGLPVGLFRQRDSMQFARLEDAARFATPEFFTHGVSVSDFNSDGLPDVLLTGYHGLALWENMGDGTFANVTDGSGLLGDRWLTSAAWGDLDNDGVLDLYIVSYVDWSFANNPACGGGGERDVCPPKEFEAESDRIYFGNGDGSFRDESESAGLVAGGKGLAVMAADVDLDADLDIYVANDTTPNLLYINDGTGKFTESAISRGVAFGEMTEAEGSMGVDMGDFDNDGLPDLWVSNYENQSFALYRNQGHGLFQHVSGLQGIKAVGAVYVGFGTCFIDADADGDLDMFATNGHVMYREMNSPYQQLPLLFENRDQGRFVNVATAAGEYTSSPHVGRGVAVGDLNNDGLPDLAVSHTNEPISLLVNETPGVAGTSVKLVGRNVNRDAIGVTINSKVNSGLLIRQVRGGTSYLSSGPRTQFFSSNATRIEPAWNDKSAENPLNISTGRWIIIEPENSHNVFTAFMLP